jgi:hypothetical protein
MRGFVQILNVLPKPGGGELKKMRIACFECRRAKSKCDEKRPCSRCVKKCISCVDPDSRMYEKMAVVSSHELEEILHNTQPTLKRLADFQFSSCVLEKQEDSCEEPAEHLLTLSSSEVSHVAFAFYESLKKNRIPEDIHILYKLFLRRYDPDKLGQLFCCTPMPM